VRGFVRLLGIKVNFDDAAEAVTPEELKSIVSESGNYLPQKNRAILMNLLDLEKITVDDIMIAHTMVAAIDLDDSIDEIRQHIANSRHTRLPIRESAHDVPSGTPLYTQIQQFQEHKERMALVVNEYGELKGLVTIEDILEELIGDFTTQSTSRSINYSQEPDGSWLVDGSCLLRDLNKKLELELPLDGPRTLNGLVIEYFEDIPEPNTSFKVGTHKLEVLQTQDRVVKSVKIFP